MKTTLKYLLFLSLFILSLTVRAQKKVMPVNRSVLTGIVLPAGSKQDKRLLSESAATVLFELESRRANTGVKNPEVLYLPSVSTCKFNADSLVAQLSGMGWEIIPIEGDDKFVWLHKDGRYLIAYFLMEETQSQLYFAESVAPPAFATGSGTIVDFIDLKILPWFSKIQTEEGIPQLLTDASATRIVALDGKYGNSGFVNYVQRCFPGIEIEKLLSL